MRDYLIIGSGLTGMTFANKALQHQKKFIVFSDHSQSSSKVAAGLYNPVILKRFTPTYNANSQINQLIEFYESLELKHSKKYINTSNLFRKFTTIEEQNNWFSASDHIKLKDFLDPRIHQIENKNIPSPFGYGRVNHSGWVDVKKFIEAFEVHLSQKKLIKFETFDYKKLKQIENGWIYDDLQTKHVIFCEGYGINKNPYFNHLPMQGTKGEVLTIKSYELKLEKLIKSNLFIIPLGDDLYRVGATYNWEDKCPHPTEIGKTELINELNKTIKCAYEIVKHEAEIRPTTKDRKPFVGEHPMFKGIYILNGLGTRGVMLAPDLSNALYHLIEDKIPLPIEIDIKRLKKIKWSLI